MDGEAVREILDNAKSEVVQVDEFSYLRKSDGVTLIAPPSLETIKCFSLSQIISVVKEAVTQKLTGRLLVNVLDHNSVSVILAIPNKIKNFDKVAHSSFNGIFKEINFGSQMSQEDFIIELMTKFEDTPEREELLRLVSSIKSEKVNTSDDDGYSQTAGVKAGVTLVTEKKIKNLWKLRTFKSFPEIEQPEIPYILRLHQRGEEAPKFALYDCDGGKWKVSTTLAVREYLSNRLNIELGELASGVVVL